MRQPSLSSYTLGIVDVLAGWRACAEPIPPQKDGGWDDGRSGSVEVYKDYGRPSLGALTKEAAQTAVEPTSVSCVVCLGCFSDGPICPVIAAMLTTVTC